MLNQTMYAGVNNSPQTTITSEITAAAQEIPVLSVAGFPAAPNLATIGTDENAEIIRYNAISGNSLTGCERGFYGTTAKIWPVDTLVYRAFSLYDYEALRSNVTQLDTDKLGADGDGSDLTAAFTSAESREAIATGETAATLWGKVSKWLSDLKAVAFSGQYADLTGAPTAMTPTSHASTHGTGGTDAITPASIGAQPSVTATGLLKGDGDGGITAAAAGTDYQAPLTAGTDYAPPSQSITATLTSTGWADNAQTLTVSGVTATRNGLLRIAQSATTEQFTAWGAALPRITAQAAGSITVTIAGTVPTVDIPVEVVIL